MQKRLPCLLSGNRPPYRWFLLYDKKQAQLAAISHSTWTVQYVGHGYALHVCALVGLEHHIASMANLLPDAFASVSIFVEHDWLPREGHIGRLQYVLHCLCGSGVKLQLGRIM